MKLPKLSILFLAGFFAIASASGQSNASLNILTLNGGQVPVGGVVDIQVTVGNTGPSSIAANKVRAQISVPGSLVNTLPNAQQTGLPPGWTITVNSGTAITICNGTDVIPAGVQRQIFIKIQGNNIGGPSTINGSLSFLNGTSCTIPGTLPGDITADNTATTSVQVVAAGACNLTVSASAGTIACNGGTTTLSATPIGAGGTVEYSITGGAPFQTSNTFTVGAGTYTVTAREVASPTCTATATPVTITQPSAISASAAAGAAIACNGGTTTLTATASGGTGALEYSLNGGTFQAGNTFTVGAGTHTVTVRDASLCTVDAVPVTVSQPTQLTASATSTPVTTVGGSDGTATVTASDGTSPYTYLWSPGGQTTATATGLSAGTYTATVTDANGCTTTASTTVGSPTCTLSVTALAGTIACNSGTTTLTATPSGAAGAVEYSITGGAPFQSSNTFTVGAGTYTVTAREVATPSCTATATPVTVTQPSAISASAAAGTAIACNGGTTTLTVTASGGTGTLEYSLNGGAFQAGNTFTVGAGTHTATVRDASLCTADAAPVTVTEPSAVSASASVTTPIPVPGGTGTITVTASGGTGTITYVITSGPTINTTGATSGVFTDLTAGAYTFTATDANGCTGVASASLADPAPGPSNPSLNILTLNAGEVQLGDVVDVQVTVGNTGPSFIGINKVRSQISIPSSIATALPNADQTGLPAGWIITSNTGGAITVCNGSDVIPAGVQRQILIKVRGTNTGGPSTINANLSFSNGTSCTIPGTVPGDIIGDNTATTSLSVIAVVTPVTLTDFDASLVNCKPVLRWVTETELNSDRFEIERHNSNGSWSVIGTVRAGNNTVSSTKYSFTDANPSSDKALYRLKMIDQDGSFEYTKTLLVITDCRTVQALVYPNPVTEGKLYVSLAGTSGYTETSLLSLSGQIILKKRMNNGTNSLDVSTIADGVYILSIKDASGIDKKVKIIIQN